MMNTKTMRKAARDLKPGDVLIERDIRRVITVTRPRTEGRLEIYSADFGDTDTSVQEVSVNAQFMVEIPAGLTPVQVAADKLLEYTRMLRELLDPREPITVRVQALLDELDPPKPPTLDEAIAVIRELVSPQNVIHSQYVKVCEVARNLLARVPD